MMREPGQDKEAVIPCGSPGLRSSVPAADSAARSHEEKDILNRLPAEGDSGPNPAHAAAPVPPGSLRGAFHRAGLRARSSMLSGAPERLCSAVDDLHLPVISGKGDFIAVTL